LVFTKFEDYWRRWDGKHFDKVVLKSVEEASTRRLLIESGKADITSRLPISMIQAMEKNPEIEIVKTGSFQNLNALFNMAKSKKYPISNIYVRKALAYTLPYTYSPAVAKFYLQKAGYPNGGFKVLLVYTSGDQQMRRVAELWKAELAKLNVELDVRNMPWDTQEQFGHQTNADDRQDIFIFYWWPDYAHPHSFMSSQYETLEPPVYNFSYYSNPVYDEMINAANAMAAENQREGINLYMEAQSILMDELPGLTIYDVDYARAKRKSLKGYVDNPAYAHVVFWYDCYRGE
jgi:peptide/nickel transport system substrate-binding protein